MRSRPSRTASVRLPARRSVSRSRTLLTTRIAAASSPTGHREHERLPRQRLELHVVRAGDGDDAEEQEHEDLAEALVAVRAAGRRCRARRRGSTRRRPAAAPGRRPRSGRRRSSTASPNADVGRDEHLARRHEAAGRHAHRPEAVLGVGAAPRVGVVVREVRADLDEERAEQRGGERERVDRALGPAPARCRRAPARPPPAASAGARPSARCAGSTALARRRHRPPRVAWGSCEKSGLALLPCRPRGPRCASSLP